LGRSMSRTTSISEETMQKVDAEIRRILDEQYAKTQAILEANRDKIEAMTVALMQWETIGREQIEDIMAGRPPKPPVDFVPRAQAADSASSGDAGGGAGAALSPAPSAPPATGAAKIAQD